MNTASVINREAVDLKMKGITLFLCLLYLCFLTPTLDLRPFNAHDSVAYLNRAWSLWKGLGYGESFLDAFYPVTIQPPAFSLFLAPLVGVFGMNFLVLKIFMVVLAAFLAWSSVVFFRTFLESGREASLATLLLMASPVIFGLSHQILSEIPLLLFSVLALVALERYLKPSVSVTSPLLALAALLTVTAYFFKVSALGVLAGVWLLFLHPRFRTFVVFKKAILLSLFVFIPMALWRSWCSTIPYVGYWTQPFLTDFLLLNPYDPASPRASLMDGIIRMRHNVAWGLAANVGMILLPPLYFIQGERLGFFLSVPILCWLAVLWFKSYRGQPSVLEGFVLFGMAVLVIKFEGMAMRYMSLLYPAFLVYALRGFRSMGLYEGWRRWVLVAIGTAALVTTVAAAVSQVQNPYGGSVARDYVDAALKAKSVLPPESTCRAPLASHWQVLTEHSCFVRAGLAGSEDGRGKSADYVVTLAGGALRDPSAFKDFENHLIKGALGITEDVEAGGVPFETVYENGTFALIRWGVAAS